MGLKRYAAAAVEFETLPTEDLKLFIGLTGRRYLSVLEDGRRFDYQQRVGAGSLIVPGDANRVRLAPGPKLDYAKIFLPGPLLSHASDTLARAGHSISVSSLAGKAFDDPAITALARALLTAAETGIPDLYADQALSWLAVHLLVSLGGNDARYAEASVSDLPDRRLQRVVAFMEAHHAEPLTLEVLAIEAGISKFHFCRLFRRRLGQTPVAFLIGARMRAARRLLIETDLPIASIAERVGYGDASQFATAFKRRFGATPSSHRRAAHRRVPCDVLEAQGGPSSAPVWS